MIFLKNKLQIVCGMICALAVGFTSVPYVSAFSDIAVVNNATQTESVQGPKLVVVSVMTPALVVQSSVVNQCSEAYRLEALDLQGIRDFDLNKPGDCFALAIGSVRQQETLAVVVPVFPQVVLAHASPGFALQHSPVLGQSGKTQPLSTSVPVSSFADKTPQVIIELASFGGTAHSAERDSHSSVSVHTLVVMRC